MTNILLADEINRASPKTQSALLEAMEEAKVTVDGVTYPVPEPFFVIATQNPTGYVGTYPLPEAQLDRFAIRLSMGYPTVEEEIRILSDRQKVNPLEKVRAVTDIQTIRTLRAMVQNVTVTPEIARYIMKLAQAYAFLRERDYVKPEDVAFVFTPGIAHRVVLSQEARLNRESAQTILGEILHQVEVPYQSGR